MVKIVEDEDEEQQEEEEAHPSHATTPSPFPTPSSSGHDHHRLSPPESPPPASPDSPSSLSSDQTFHGFSPKPSPPPEHHPSPTPAVVSRLIRDESAPPVTVTESGPVSGFAFEGGNGEDGEGVGRGREGGASKGKAPSLSSLSALRRPRRVATLRTAALGLRVCEFVFCLISFSVMAADRNRGWALDSFDRYKEFRYSMSVNVMGFAYSGLQGYSLVYQLTTGKQNVWGGHFRCYFDFLVDQILAYLLVSASSSAATRVDDWILNWGQDKFPAMASASVGMSFLAFVAFALSSLISGYILCTL